MQSLWDVNILGRKIRRTWFWERASVHFSFEIKEKRKRSCWSKTKLECELLLLWVTMNRTNETGEDANITISLKERKKSRGQDSTYKAGVFIIIIYMSSQVLFSSFPLCTRQAFSTGNPPCLCPKVIWTPRSHLRKGYPFRGDWKRIPMELPITSILKQKPCKPSHHGNHRPWWENCQVLLRLQLRPQKKKCICISKCLVWKLEE